MTPGQSTTAAVATSGSLSSLRWFVFALFFIFGGLTSLNDVLIPKLKPLFDLSWGEVMLVQSAFFLAYFVVSLPAAALVQRFGYMRTAVIGLLTMTAGCLLFIPASVSGMFVTFLAALFVLASGITIVQVVANPLISMLGSAETAPSRLTFAQAFNSLGTTVFPYVGAIVILGSLASVDASTLSGDALAAFRAEETRVIDRTYLAIAAALVVVAGVVWLQRNRLREERGPSVNFVKSLDLLNRPRFRFGTLGIFLYVGAEVAIGSLLANYLMQSDTLGLTPREAGERVALYWGGAMIGRFVGAAILRRFAPGLVLSAAALCVITLLIISGLTDGPPSGAALLAVGLFNSIMFPTIFTLASDGLGQRVPEGSGIICMAIVGGAIIPPLTGLVADASSLRGALIVPALCYVGIALFGRYCYRNPSAVDGVPSAPPITTT